MQLRTDLQTREEQAAYLAEALAGLFEGAAQPSPIRGGRRAALRRLRAFNVQHYARTRNDVVNRGVSMLSPYIRHGVLTLA
ncbi:MAG: DNA photolyase, partial [Chloroflexus sp.]|nr:DNA photolyase [Chloroflexus sp.]